MSETSESGTNGTIIVSGPDVLQISDFYVKAGVLNFVVVGSIAVVVLFGYLRMGSNRSMTPITTFDWLINVALGSTLAGIVNGNSLVRGLLGLATMLGFQYAISLLTSRFHQKLSWIFEGPPLVVVFRGKMLTRVMKKHRISKSDVNVSLRDHGVLNVFLVECAIIELNGAISVFMMRELEEAKVEPEVLMAVPAYKALCESDVEAGNGDIVRRCESGRSGQETTESRNVDDGKPGEASCDSNSVANAAS